MKFETEKQSIDFLVTELTKRGFTGINPTQSTNKYCYYDLEAEKDGKLYRFECKRRNMTSERYGDSIIEFHKYLEFIKHKEARGFLITFFDDCWTVSDIYYPIGESRSRGAKTTDFEDRRIVDKNFVHYKLDKIFDYEQGN